MPAIPSRPAKAILWFALFTSLLLIIFLYVGESNPTISSAGSRHELSGPELSQLPRYVLPTSTPGTTERILVDAHINPSRHTLGDLVDGLGPPEIYDVLRYGVESSTSRVRFVYVKEGLTCYTAWNDHYEGIKRGLFASCDSQYFNINSLPPFSEWKGFDD